MGDHFKKYAFGDFPPGKNEAPSGLTFVFSITVNELIALAGKEPQTTPRHEAMVFSKEAFDTNKRCIYTCFDGEDNPGTYSIKKDLYAIFAVTGHLVKQQHEAVTFITNEATGRSNQMELSPEQFAEDHSDNPEEFKLNAVGFYRTVLDLVGADINRRNLKINVKIVVRVAKLPREQQD